MQWSADMDYSCNALVWQLGVLLQEYCRVYTQAVLVSPADSQPRLNAMLCIFVCFAIHARTHEAAWRAV
jgi:hypothetical protein